MTTRAIDPMGSARIDDVRDPYRAERVRAQTREVRTAGLKPAPFAAIASLHSPMTATTSGLPRPGHAQAQVSGMPLDPLRDQYTAHCVKQAIAAFHAQQARQDAHTIAVNRALRDEQTALQARADAANDLGTIQALLPQQAYRFVVSAPGPSPQPLATGAGRARRRDEPSG